ncbi:uncharacterized protein LOC132315047 [Cornus florida]|uniref:uncharacterized protein LOC132315047 n=1 Tax=Cornus florida TaxID=4283 RepID=UPI00289D7021|nr:uncharacterized protein LOC132315047 [Cornus florida]
MTSLCISKCVDDARVPVRATYVNLYKWPESDAEFVKTVAAANVRGGGHGGQHQHQHPRVVDSISCRQVYLRSYTFSRKETVPERTKKCLGRVKERVSRERRRKGNGARGSRRCVVVRRVRELSCAALCVIFRRMLSCTATVDVVDHRD